MVQVHLGPTQLTGSAQLGATERLIQGHPRQRAVPFGDGGAMRRLIRYPTRTAAMGGPMRRAAAVAVPRPSGRWGVDAIPAIL